MSLAVFTDSKATTGAWTAGTIALTVGPTSTTFNVTGILPGDTGSSTVVVTNTGTGDLRYALSSAPTNLDGLGLAGQMTMTINAGTCAAPGAQLYSGPLSGAAFGSAVQGPHVGDQTVPALSSQSLCFAWEFPLGSGNAFKNAATTDTFTFDAEQTAHN
jgi:hypothetical protein